MAPGRCGIAPCVTYLERMDLIEKLRAALRAERDGGPVDDTDAVIAEISEALGQRAVVVTGGDTGIGEVLRGDVLHVDYDEAEENAEYAREMLAEAEECSAPGIVVESLREIVARHSEG